MLNALVWVPWAIDSEMKICVQEVYRGVLSRRAALR